MTTRRGDGVVDCTGGEVDSSPKDATDEDDKGLGRRRCSR